MAGITTRSVRNDTAQLSELIGDIYDAALDPTRWIMSLRGPHVCRRAGRIALFKRYGEQDWQRRLPVRT